ncbi:MAG: zeta toxin family protein [Alphaproteobacteria bacterium]|nr:zeta toxin family protein [Alphaproteobacteria bacterium]
MTGPEPIILAGPNGVGKTTFAQRNLRPFIEQGAFLNADDMARDTNPSDVEAVAMEAGRRMLGRRKDFLERRQSFCRETTLATRTLLRFVHQATTAGYRTRLFFLFTPLPYLNELRVKQRVMSGGHNIDTDTIRRRHRLGLELLAVYWAAVDEGVALDARTREPIEIVRKDDTGIRVRDEAAFALLNAAIAANDGKPL